MPVPCMNIIPGSPSQLVRFPFNSLSQTSMAIQTATTDDLSANCLSRDEMITVWSNQ